MNLVDKKEIKNTRTSLDFRKTLEMCFFCGKKDEPKNQTLELHSSVKNEEDMVVSDAKCHLNCLTPLY